MCFWSFCGSQCVCPGIHYCSLHFPSVSVSVSVPVPVSVSVSVPVSVSVSVHVSVSSRWFLQLGFISAAALWHLLKIFWYFFLGFVTAGTLGPLSVHRKHPPTNLKGRGGLRGMHGGTARREESSFVYLSFRSVSNNKSFWLYTYYAVAARQPSSPATRQPNIPANPLSLCNVQAAAVAVDSTFVKRIVLSCRPDPLPFLGWRSQADPISFCCRFFFSALAAFPVVSTAFFLSFLPFFIVTTDCHRYRY